MRNKIEFENRVREIAVQKKKKNATRFKVVRNVAIASGSVLAACFVVSILVRGQFIFSQKIQANSDEDRVVGSSGPGYLKDEPNVPEQGANDGLLDTNNDSLVQNNQIPPQRVELQIGDEGFALSGDVSGEMVAWLNKLNYAKPAEIGDINSEEVIEVRYIYMDTEKVCLVFENYIKIDNGEWQMLDEEDREEFDKIIKKVREE